MKPIRNKSFDPAKIIFITGTDTGVGKTLLTALLLAFLRKRGYQALAIKPFCTGSWEDVELLNALQDDVLTKAEACPFFFPEPVAPLVAAGRSHQSIPLSGVLSRIDAQKRRCKHLLIEGIGGLMVPLSKGYTVLDLIVRLEAQVIVVAPNQLGVLSHALVTSRVLDASGVKDVTYVLMGRKAAHLAMRTNPGVLAELLAHQPVYSLPFLGNSLRGPTGVKKSLKKVEKTLAQILRISNLCAHQSC